MTFEDYYCGFTSDSHPAFSVSPDAGKMERRNGPPTTVTVTCNPKASRDARGPAAAPYSRPRDPPNRPAATAGRLRRAGRLPLLHPARGEGLFNLLQSHVQLAVEAAPLDGLVLGPGPRIDTAHMCMHGPRRGCYLCSSAPRAES